MKRTLLFVVLLAVLTVGAANAQIFKLGVKAGAIINQNKLTVAGAEYKSAPAGFDVGLQMQVKIPVVGIFVQPEVLYSYSSSKYNVVTGQVKSVTNQLDVPVMLGWKIAFFRVQAGPVFSFPFTNMNGNLGGVGANFKDYNTGYVAGVGFDIGRFTLDARYQGDFKAREAEILGVNVPEVKLLQGRFSFSLGYTLFKI